MTKNRPSQFFTTQLQMTKPPPCELASNNPRNMRQSRNYSFSYINANTGRKFGTWSEEEDQLLLGYVKLYGAAYWNLVPKITGLLRSGKSCRARWYHYLSPDINVGDFTDKEKDLISELHVVFGNKWSTIARSLPGRTNHSIRNYWVRTNKLKKAAATASTGNDKAKSKEAAASGHHDNAKPSFATVFSKNRVIINKLIGLENQTDSDEGKFPDLNLDLTLSFPCQKKVP